MFHLEGRTDMKLQLPYAQEKAVVKVFNYCESFDSHDLSFLVHHFCFAKPFSCPLCPLLRALASIQLLADTYQKHVILWPINHLT